MKNKTEASLLRVYYRSSNHRDTVSSNTSRLIPFPKESVVAGCGQEVEISAAVFSECSVFIFKTYQPRVSITNYLIFIWPNNLTICAIIAIYISFYLLLLLLHPPIFNSICFGSFKPFQVLSHFLLQQKKKTISTSLILI